MTPDRPEDGPYPATVGQVAYEVAEWIDRTARAGAPGLARAVVEILGVTCGATVDHDHGPVTCGLPLGHGVQHVAMCWTCMENGGDFRLHWTAAHASIDAPQLTERAHETGKCSQCGKGFAELACGPTHAVAAAVWFGGEKQAQTAEALRRERDEQSARADEWHAAAVVMTRVAMQRTLAGDELAAAVREWIRPDADVSNVERVERAVNAWTVIRETS